MKIGELIIWIVMAVIVTWFSFASVTIHNKIDANTENIDTIYIFLKSITDNQVANKKRIGELAEAGTLSSEAGLIIIAELQELIAELERKGIIESDAPVDKLDADLDPMQSRWMLVNGRDI